MIPALLTAVTAFRTIRKLADSIDGMSPRRVAALTSRSPRRRETRGRRELADAAAAEPDTDAGRSILRHPIVTAAAVAIGAQLLTRAVVRKKRYDDLAGKTVVVTGGSQGLGLELARQLVDRGANVAICARGEATLREAQDELTARGGHVLAMPCDVTNRAEVRAFVDQVRERFGTIDVLINNAGTITVGPVDTMRDEDFARSMAVNYEAPLRFILEVLPDMRRRGTGRIANVASIGGRVAVPHLAAYCASKFALVGLSEALRVEMTPHNVFVTTVCPGTIRTGSPKNATFKGDADAEHAWFATADNLPLLSISPERLAGQILDAVAHGDAEIVTPLPAKAQSVLWGTCPGVMAEVTTLLGRLLPESNGDATSRPGESADRSRMPAWTAEMQEAAEARYQ